MTREWMRGKGPCSRSKRGSWYGSLLSVFYSATVTRWLSYIRYSGNELLCWQQPHVRETLPYIKGCKIEQEKCTQKNLFRNVWALLFPFWVALHPCHKFQGHGVNSQFWPASEPHRIKTHQVRFSQYINYIQGVNQAPLEAALTFLGHQDNSNWITASVK